MAGIRIVLLLLIAVGIVSRAAASDLPTSAPLVLSRTPEHLSRDFPPGTSDLVVRFDRPMSRSSWSFCGGGEDFPKFVGSPAYIDDQTIMVTVSLEPRKTYSLSLNCGGGRGFVSIEGQPLEPVPYIFTTGAQPGKPPISLATNYEAWKEFRRVWDGFYSYRDRTGTDWEVILRDGESWVVEAPSPKEFGMRLWTLLLPADDPHLRIVLPDDERMTCCMRGARMNADFDMVDARLTQRENPSAGVYTGMIDTIGYLRIDHWSHEEAGMAAIHKALAALRDTTTALIVDVRANGGGSEDQGLEVAAWFMDGAAVYSQHRKRNPDFPGGWSDIRSRWVRPSGDPERRYTKPVYVLQGQRCMSSNESFLLAIQQASTSLLIGERTRGSSGNPRRFPLPNGTQLSVPSWEDLLPDGRLMEGYGVDPDIGVEWVPGGVDVVFEKALELARQSAAAPE